jgi:hypothetical protein
LQKAKGNLLRSIVQKYEVQSETALVRKNASCGSMKRH